MRTASNKARARAPRVRAATHFADTDFPLKVMRMPSHGTTRLHGHEFHELVIILRGQGRHRLDDEEYRIEAGDVFLIRGRMAHGYTSARNMDLINLLFAPRRLRLPLGELQEVPGYHVLFHLEPRFRQAHRFESKLHLDFEQLAQAEQLLTRMREELTRRTPGYRFMARTLLMQLIGFLSRSYAPGKSGRVQAMHRLGEALGFLHRHYDEKISLARIARVAHMSQSTLVRAFRSATGASPIDYLIRLRVERAAELLRSHEFSVTEAALRTGFSDSNYFARQFRRILGVTPRQHRRQSAIATDQRVLYTRATTEDQTRHDNT